MNLLASLICRVGGHKPYEHPRVQWVRQPGANFMDGQMMMIKRCKRCGVELSRRPMIAGEDEVEA